MTQPTLNYLALEPERPTRLTIGGWLWEDREIRDPATREVKVVRAMVLKVAKVDGQERETTLSFISRKAQNALLPYLDSGLAMRREVEITRRGRGYATDYEVRIL